MRHLSRALLITAILSSTGCFAVRYSAGDIDPAVRKQAVVKKTWSHSLIWGLASANKIDVDAMCGPQGAMEMRSHYGPFGLFAQVISAGFWTPLRVKVTCNPPLPPPAIASAPPPPVPGTPLAVPANDVPDRTAPRDGILVIPEEGRTVIVIEQ